MASLAPTAPRTERSHELKTQRRRPIFSTAGLVRISALHSRRVLAFWVVALALTVFAAQRLSAAPIMVAVFA
jgi:hypothetical protein